MYKKLLIYTLPTQLSNIHEIQEAKTDKEQSSHVRYYSTSQLQRRKLI